ncbi:hypothetical protein B0H11DRAFT_2345261 [Mycena galericulata]|nr:hypothetical protein B0H11DRAFT_2345261 [Mycena galericulata]
MNPVHSGGLEEEVVCSKATMEEFILELFLAEVRLQRRIFCPVDLAEIRTASADWPRSMTATAHWWVAHGRRVFEPAVIFAVNAKFEGFTHISGSTLNTFCQAVCNPPVPSLLLKLLSNPHAQAPFDMDGTFFALIFHLSTVKGMPAVDRWVAENLGDLLGEMFWKAHQATAAKLPKPTPLPRPFLEMRAYWKDEERLREAEEHQQKEEGKTEAVGAAASSSEPRLVSFKGPPPAQLTIVHTRFDRSHLAALDFHFATFRTSYIQMYFIQLQTESTIKFIHELFPLRPVHQYKHPNAAQDTVSPYKIVDQIFSTSVQNG